jgi:diketogulonate reductase-like aldo/keto reductase
MPLMAYSPVEQGRLARNGRLDAIARRHGATPAQVALAWALAQPGVIAIPKAVKPEHVRQNVAAADIRLTADDLAELDRAFPPPGGKRSLEMI